MKKKIRFIACMFVVCATVTQAKVYTSGVVQSALTKKGIYMNGSDYERSTDTSLDGVSVSKKGKSEHTLSVGASLGYIHEMAYVNPFIEADYLFTSKQYKTELMDYHSSPDNALQDERISIKAGHSFGVTFGLEKNVSDKVAVFSGVRSSLDQFEVHAFHNGNINLLDVRPGNDHKKTKYLLRIEPHLGVKYYHTDNSFARFSAGYVFARKTKFFNYIQDPESVETYGASSNVAIKPQGVVFRLSVGMNLN